MRICLLLACMAAAGCAGWTEYRPLTVAEHHRFVDKQAQVDRTQWERLSEAVRMATESSVLWKLMLGGGGLSIVSAWAGAVVVKKRGRSDG